MPACQPFEDALLEAAVWGETPPELAAHMEECEACRQCLRTLSSAAKGFAALRRVDAPDPRAALWERLDRPARRMRWIPLLAGAVVVCVVLALAVLREVSPPRTVRGPQHPAARRAPTIAQHQPLSAAQGAPVLTPRIISVRPEPRLRGHGRIHVAANPRKAPSLVQGRTWPMPPAPAKDTPADQPPTPAGSELVGVFTPAPLDQVPARSCRQFTVLLTVHPDRPQPPRFSPDPTYQALAVPTVRCEGEVPVFAPVRSGSQGGLS